MKIFGFKNATLLVFFTIIFLTLNINTASATEFVVKPVILVPSDYAQSYPEEYLIKNYSHNIAFAFQEVQKFYADNLDGKTFNYDKNVQIVYSDKSFSEENYELKDRILNPYITSPAGYFQKLNGFLLLPRKEGTIYIVFLIGSKIPAAQGMQTGDAGYVFIPEYLLNFLDYLPPRNKFDNDPFPIGGHTLRIGLAAIAHELGHALGLTLSPYAKSHPCTIISPQECTTLATDPPGIGEWYGSIMGGDLGPGFYPQVGFNNSLYNPEIQTLLNSPFINPNLRDFGQEVESYEQPPAPLPSMPLASEPSKMIPQIDELSADVIQKGDTLEIRGQNFGDGSGTYSILFASDGYDWFDIIRYKIVSWSDNLIIVKFDDIKVNYDTQWRILIRNNENEIGGYEGFFTILGYTPPPTSLQINFNVGCMENGQEKPFPGVIVELYKSEDKFLKPNEDNSPIVTDVTDWQGKGVIRYVPEDVSQTSAYILVGKPIISDSSEGNIEASSPDGSNLFIIRSLNQEVKKVVKLVYNRCPMYSDDSLNSYNEITQIGNQFVEDQSIEAETSENEDIMAIQPEIYTGEEENF